MRQRDRILTSLDKVYREAFEAAQARDDRATADRLDFEYQRDQIHLEVLLDLRDLLAAGAAAAQAPSETSESAEASGGASATGVADLLDKAQAIRRFTRLR